MIYLITFWRKLSLCHLDFLYLSQLYAILFLFWWASWYFFRYSPCPALYVCWCIRRLISMFTLTLLAEMSMSESVCNFPCLMCCFCMFFSGRAETVKIPASWAKRYVCVVFFHYYGSSCPWCYDGSWALYRIWVSFRWHFCVTFTMTLLAEMSSHHNVVVGERDLFWWWFSGTCSFRFFLKLMTNGLFSLSIYGLTMILVYARKFYKIFSAHLARICAFIFIFY